MLNCLTAPKPLYHKLQTLMNINKRSYDPRPGNWLNVQYKHPGSSVLALCQLRRICHHQSSFHFMLKLNVGWQWIFSLYYVIIELYPLKFITKLLSLERDPLFFMDLSNYHCKQSSCRCSFTSKLLILPYICIGATSI